MRKLNAIQVALLGNVAKRGADLRKVSEQYRQHLITFGMMEPPLVDVDADRVTINAAGRAALTDAERKEK